MDNIDKSLVKLLAKDARISNVGIAKELGLTVSTVRRRVNSLLSRKSIRIVAIIDPDQFGLNLCAIMALDVEPKCLSNAINTLSQREEVSWFACTSGRFDIIVILRMYSTQDLYDFIENVTSTIEGLKNVETFVCLGQSKTQYSSMFSQ